MIKDNYRPDIYVNNKNVEKEKEENCVEINIKCSDKDFFKKEEKPCFEKELPEKEEKKEKHKNCVVINIFCDCKEKDKKDY